MKLTTLAAAILAGGRARRLGGVNKGALTLGSSAIVDRQLEVIRTVAAHIFVVGGAAEAWAVRGLRVVPDALPGTGPLGGIWTALTASPAERTLIVACDLPFISADLLRRMAAEPGDVVVARSARGLEPLCAIYSARCLPDIRARIDQGALEASTLPRGVAVVELGREIVTACDPDGRLFLNVNTPHDYARAKGMIDMNLDSDPESNEDRITTERSPTPPTVSPLPTK